MGGLGMDAEELGLLVELKRERDPARYEVEAWFRYSFGYLTENGRKEYILRPLPPPRK